MNSSLKPINKVTYGSLTGVVALIATYLLVHFALHRQLTTEEQVLVVSIVPLITGWFVAYMTKHDPKMLAQIEADVPPAL